MSALPAAPDPLLGPFYVPFECALTTAGARTAWVRVAGELDLSTSPRLDCTLREAQLDFRAVVLDTRAVSFIDCNAVRVILSANAGADWGMPPLKLLPGRVVHDLLRLLGVREEIWTFDLDQSEVVPGEAGLPAQRYAETSRCLSLSGSASHGTTARDSAEAMATPSPLCAETGVTAPRPQGAVTPTVVNRVVRVSRDP